MDQSILIVLGITLGFIILGLIFFLAMRNNQKYKKSIEFSDFMKYAEENKIKKVKIFMNYLLVDFNDGFLPNNEPLIHLKYYVYFHPYYLNFIDELRAKNITISFAPCSYNYSMNYNRLYYFGFNNNGRYW
jgi:ATP-dependent Zn protease